MNGFKKFDDYRIKFVVSLFIILFLLIPSVSTAATKADLSKFQRSIVDYRRQLNPRFKKIKRAQTRYVIVHTSELGLNSTLRVISKGKRMPSGRRTRGGHTHYVIARDGRTYRTLDRRYQADHAGRSMWNGETNISKISIGIELVGNHYKPITRHQYRSIGIFIDIHQGVYN